MRRNEFIRYLTASQYPNGKPFAKSTAEEMASLCSSIEKEYGMDLDVALRDRAQKARLLGFVSTIKRAKPDKYMRAILNYVDFLNNEPSLITRGNFSYYPDAVLDGIDEELLMKMEGEYECILGFGRDEFFKKACKERIERIPVILSPDIKHITYKTDEADIAKEICELAKRTRGDISEMEVLAILRKRVNFEDRLLGEFYSDDKPYIVLYYNAIGGKTKEEKIAGLAQVLAHEYMHYMEYVYCSSFGSAHYQNKLLSEAMADFFGVLYLLHSIRYRFSQCVPQKKAAAERRYSLWLKHFGSCWPYAEALRFYSVGGIEMGFAFNYQDYEAHGSVEKLVNVFKKCTNANSAYGILVNG